MDNIIKNIGAAIKKGVVDSLQDVGSKAGNAILDDIIIKGNPIIKIKGAQLSITSEGNTDVIDIDRNKSLISFPLPLNIIITIPDISIPIKIESKLK